MKIVHGSNLDLNTLTTYDNRNRHDIDRSVYARDIDIPSLAARMK
jgi:hypothetical protein